MDTTFLPSDDVLIWIDAEFTGLNIDSDELLEVACIPTDYKLHQLADGINLIIRPSDSALDNMSDFVYKMHTESGLINELADGIDIQVAEQQLLAYIKQFAITRGEALLAGNSIWSDKRFLDKFMPKVSEHLSYRMIDVSSVKMLVKKWYPSIYDAAPQKEGTHRALVDIEESIEELMYYRNKVFVEGGIW